VTVELIVAPPPLPEGEWLRPSYYTPRNICYVDRQEKIVNYHNKAIVRESVNRDKSRRPTLVSSEDESLAGAVIRIVRAALKSDASGHLVQIFSEDLNLLQAIACSVIIYQSGNYFDRIARFRVHALGFTFNGKAFLVLLPMGGGKSTLLLRLLKDSRVKLLSEDTPLISSSGLVYPFPIKVGIIAGQVPKDIPREYIVEMQHLEGPRKEVISLAYFNERIEREPTKVAGVFLGERFLGAGTKVEKVSYCKAWRRFFRDCVIGLGVYQGLEFAVSSSLLELGAYSLRGIKRSVAVSRFVSHAARYEFQMGTDPEGNADTLIHFLEKHFG
jgi:hypothetical protein